MSSVPPPEIEPLDPGDWREYRELRLAALLDAPDSFRQTHAEEAAAPETGWTRFLGTRCDGSWDVLMARRQGHAVGITSMGIRDGSLLSIGGMWVVPGARRTGVGAALLAAAMAWGRARGARRARFAVSRANAEAKALYSRAGFGPTGEVELLRDGSPIQVAWLERDL